MRYVRTHSTHQNMNRQIAQIRSRTGAVARSRERRAAPNDAERRAKTKRIKNHDADEDDDADNVARATTRARRARREAGERHRRSRIARIARVDEDANVGTTRAGRARAAWQSAHGITSPFTSAFLLRNAISNVNCLGQDTTGATCVDGSASPGVPIQDWDVSGITDFSTLFSSKPNFNGNISAWDVSAATNMRNMFADASNFNGDISGWNVANVEDMRSMFKANYVFDQDISGWNVAAVKSADDMFSKAVAFNKDITSWDMATIKAQGYVGTNRMFNGATAWLAAFSSVSPTVRTDGPPSLWVYGSAPSSSSAGTSVTVEDFPEWGVALVALSLALSTITSVIVILRALCAPKIVYPAERV